MDECLRNDASGVLSVSNHFLGAFPKGALKLFGLERLVGDGGGIFELHPVQDSITPTVRAL